MGIHVGPSALTVDTTPSCFSKPQLFLQPGGDVSSTLRVVNTLVLSWHVAKQGFETLGEV